MPRAPVTLRFIGHSTWMSRTGSTPNFRGSRVLTRSTTVCAIVLGFSAGDQVEVRGSSPVAGSDGKHPLVDLVGAAHDARRGRLSKHLGQADDRHRAGIDQIGSGTGPARPRAVDPRRRRRSPRVAVAPPSAAGWPAARRSSSTRRRRADRSPAASPALRLNWPSCRI